MIEEDAPSFLPLARIAARKGPPEDRIFRTRVRRSRSPLLRPERPHPTRDAILAYLAVPRSACEVAAKIHKPLSYVRALLYRLREQGFVRRIGYDMYAKAGYRGPAAARGAQHTIASLSLLERIRVLLRTRKSLTELCGFTGATAKDVRAVLRRLQRAGEVSGDDESGYSAKEPPTGR